MPAPPVARYLPESATVKGDGIEVMFVSLELSGLRINDKNGRGPLLPHTSHSIDTLLT